MISKKKKKFTARNMSTFVVEKSAVRTQVLLVVPCQVPGLPRSHTAAFTPNTGHAYLQKSNIVIYKVYETLGMFFNLNIIDKL